MVRSEPGIRAPATSQNAAELISVVALAVSANLKVQDIHESLFVYPTLSEALSEAAE